jgi:itaconate CoA-transferase
MKSYDMLIQAETGLASLTGPAEAPGRVGASVTDIAAGLNAYAAVLEALMARERTGAGALILVSLFDATAEWMAVPLIHFEQTGRAPARMGLAHPSVAPYGLFATADNKEILIAIQNEREWRRFCAEILGDATLADDPRFSDNNKRVEHRREVDGLVAIEFARHSRSELAERLKSAGIAFGNFNTVEDFARHPHLRRIAVETPEGAVQLPAAPAVFEEERTPGRVPTLGEHTAAIRAEFGR